MDLNKLLQHDVRDNLMVYFTLETVMTISMISKTSPDLTKHRKIKDTFFNSLHQDPYFFNKFRKNDKLISLIYEHKIIAWKNFVNEGNTYKIVKYYSVGDCDIEKIFLSVINNDISYIYFCLFVNKVTCYENVKLSSICSLFYKYDMHENFENFKNQTSQFTDPNDIIKFPWLIISCIAKNYDMIKNILNLYNSCPYYYDMNDLGNAHPTCDLLQFDRHPFLYYHIRIHYPELKDLFDLIMINDKKMFPIVCA